MILLVEVAAAGLFHQSGSLPRYSINYNIVDDGDDVVMTMVMMVTAPSDTDHLPLSFWALSRPFLGRSPLSSRSWYPRAGGHPAHLHPIMLGMCERTQYPTPAGLCLSLQHPASHFGFLNFSNCSTSSSLSTMLMSVVLFLLSSPFSILSPWATWPPWDAS